MTVHALAVGGLDVLKIDRLLDERDNFGPSCMCRFVDPMSLQPSIPYKSCGLAELFPVSLCRCPGTKQALQALSSRRHNDAFTLFESLMRAAVEDEMEVDAAGQEVCNLLLSERVSHGPDQPHLNVALLDG